MFEAFFIRVATPLSTCTRERGIGKRLQGCCVAACLLLAFSCSNSSRKSASDEYSEEGQTPASKVSRTESDGGDVANDDAEADGANPSSTKTPTNISSTSTSSGPATQASFKALQANIIVDSCATALACHGTPPAKNVADYATKTAWDRDCAKILMRIVPGSKGQMPPGPPLDKAAMKEVQDYCNGLSKSSATTTGGATGSTSTKSTTGVGGTGTGSSSKQSLQEEEL